MPPESAWKPFRTRAHREQQERRARPGFEPRRKKRNRRRRRARQRGYTDLKLVRQWVAEIPWTPSGSEKTYRMILRRQKIEQSEGQEPLFDFYRYRYGVTNLPASWSAEEVIDATYPRCDQENVMEQMGNGVALWRMAVAEFEGNCAWLEIGRLAWNLGKRVGATRTVRVDPRRHNENRPDAKRITCGHLPASRRTRANWADSARRALVSGLD